MYLLEVQFAVELTLKPHCSVVCSWHVSGVWAASVTQAKDTAAASMVLQNTGSMRTKAMSCNEQRIVAMCVKCFHLIKSTRMHLISMQYG